MPSSRCFASDVFAAGLSWYPTEMNNRPSFHEDIRRQGPLVAGSERSFGFVFAAVFVLIGLWPLLNGGSPNYWALVAAAVFAGIALTVPRVLRPLNAVWFRFGLVLHRIVSPLVLALLFFVAVTPIALIYRLLGKDPLRLHFDRTGSSYWIAREPPGPPADTMTRQF